MGFLKISGNVLEFSDSIEFHSIIRKHAVQRIIEWINESKQKTCCPKFGYEVIKYTFLLKRLNFTKFI